MLSLLHVTLFPTFATTSHQAPKPDDSNWATRTDREACSATTQFFYVCLFVPIIVESVTYFFGLTYRNVTDKLIGYRAVIGGCDTYSVMESKYISQSTQFPWPQVAWVGETKYAAATLSLLSTTYYGSYLYQNSVVQFITKAGLPYLKSTSPLEHD